MGEQGAFDRKSFEERNSPKGEYRHPLFVRRALASRAEELEWIWRSNRSFLAAAGAPKEIVQRASLQEEIAHRMARRLRGEVFLIPMKEVMANTPEADYANPISEAWWKKLGMNRDPLHRER